MSTKNRKKSKPKLGDEFFIYASYTDKHGVKILGRSGFISVDPKLSITNDFKKAKIFKEKESGHGSSEDWVNYMKEEFPFCSLKAVHETKPTKLNFKNLTDF